MRPATRDQLHAICSDESPEPTYRYSYVRTRSTDKGRATVVLYNPVHRGDQSDQTTGKCMTWLCSDDEIGEVEFVNLFAYRHFDPLALVALARSGTDVIGPENDLHIKNAISRSDLVVLAWGSNPRLVDPGRSAMVRSWIDEPQCFGLNADGSPIHPNRRGTGKGIRALRYLGRG
jgi:hypothetical protein